MDSIEIEQTYNEPLDIQSINIQASEWFDRLNGNSYFSAVIQINGEQIGILPFQYGYGDHYLDMANGWLHDNGFINNPKNENGSRPALSFFCRDHGIVLYTHKDENCKKRDLMRA